MYHDLITPEGVAALMESSRNRDEWNRNCGAVRAANGGNLPWFYSKTVLASGLINRVAETWGDPSAFDIELVEIR